jgi:NAD(P)H dehydrogenase (quinone)
MITARKPDARSAPEHTILVTSAAGRTGIPTTLQLLKKGYRVRALVRVDDARAGTLRHAGAEVLVGNLADPRDLRRAMRGVRRAYFCAPMAHNGLHYANVFALAARDAGVEHVVQLGQWLSQEDHPSLYTREIHLIDHIIPAVTGATHTIINVGWFAANYFFVLRPAVQLGLFPMPLGDGLNAPPSNEDIARVIVGALDRPDSHAGKSYRPTGPRLLSPEEIVAHIAEAAGRPIRYRPLSERLILKSVRADGWPAGPQTQFVQYLEEYRRGTFAVGAPTDAVRTVAGVEAEDFAATARRYVGRDPVGRPTLTGAIGAAAAFGKALLTKPIDPINEERKRDHALIRDGQLCQDSPEWRTSHSETDGISPPAITRPGRPAATPPAAHPSPA